MSLAPNNDQNAALAYIGQWADDLHGDLRFMSLSGAAGTGKSTAVRFLRPLLEAAGKVAWTATTGKAARRLSQAAGVPAITLHSRLYESPDDDEQGPKFDKLQKPFDGIVVCDEASMITPAVYEHMQQWAEAGTRFLLVGDPYQLPPIMTAEEEKTYGDSFTVFSEVNGATLLEVMRSDDSITALAHEIRSTGQLPLRSRDGYEFRRAPCHTAMRDYLDDPDDHVLITWRNKLRMKANRAIRKMLGRKSELPEVGESVMFCKNSQMVLNGEVGICHEIIDGPTLAEVKTHELRFSEPYGIGIDGLDAALAVRVATGGREEPMDGSMPWVKDWGKYRAAIAAQQKKDPVPAGRRKAPPVEPVPITWSYALSCHRSQGSEWRRATIFLADWDTTSRPFLKPTALPDGRTMPFFARWLYTAVTRAKTQVTVVVGPE